MTGYRIDFATRTETGLVRSGNEDAVATRPDSGVVVVADGMGGYRAGEVASQLAVGIVSHHLETRLDGCRTVDHCLDAAEQAVAEANLAIWRAASEKTELRGMGTTVVLGIFQDADLAFAWVGDSRLYRVRNGRLVQLTIDHSLAQELVDQGMFDSVTDAVAAGVGENVLTYALGMEATVPVDTGSLDITGGDVYLFCTDGLNHMVDDGSVQAVLVDAALGLEAKADRMIELACNAGGLDNITVVLAEVVGVEALSGD